MPTIPGTYETRFSLTHQPASAPTLATDLAPEGIRVNAVVPGSVEKEPETNTLRFAVVDTKSKTGISVPVLYTGVVPDAFKQGADVVLEGRLISGGTFKAESLLVKCPSKYKAKPAQPTEGMS